MSDSSLSFASTSTFRNNLLGRNLAPYTVQGVFTPPISNVAYVMSQYLTKISRLTLKISPGHVLSATR